MIPFRAIPAPRWLWWLGLTWIIAYLAHLAWLSWPVRLACVDDRGYQYLVDHHTCWDRSIELAHEQARFYMPIAFGPIALFYRIANDLWFSIARAALLGLEVFALARLTAAVTGSPRFALAASVLFLLTLQIALPFNLVLSYPQIGLGFALFGLTCTAAVEADTSWRNFVVVALGAFFSASLNEVFTLPLLFVAAVWWITRPAAKRGSAAILVGMGLYLAVYGMFRLAHPSRYAGTEFQLHPFAALDALARQWLGTMPGFELVVNRYGFHLGNFFKSSRTIADILARVSVADVLLALAGAALAIAIGARPRGTMELRRVLPFSLGLAIAFVLPMALTPKYQIWVHQRQFPYAYALYAYYFLLLSAAALAVVASSQVRRRSSQIAAAVAATLLLFFSGVAAAASNRHVVSVLARATYPLTEYDMRRLGLDDSDAGH